MKRIARSLTALLLLWPFIPAAADGSPNGGLPAWAIPQPIPIEKIPTLRAQDLANTIPLIGADAAWKAGFRGSGVNILIIDDFKGEPSHGLWVSGIIHAIAPDAKLWQISLPTLDDADVVVALESAYRDQPKKNYTLLNYSLGSKRPYAPRCSADAAFINDLQLQEAQLLRALRRDEGVLSVAAVGNDGNPFELSFPACLAEDVLPAAASWDETDTQGPFTFDHCQQLAVTDEPMCFSNSSLEDPPLYAPGWQSDVPGVGKNDKLNAGTSASAPVIVGAAALLTQAVREADQIVSPDQLSQLLFQTGTIISDPRNGGHFPRVNLSAALAEASVGSGGTPHPPATLTEIAAALDTNHNHHIDDAEMIEAVGLWVTGRVVPATNGAVIDDDLIVQLMALWVRGAEF